MPDDDADDDPDYYGPFDAALKAHDWADTTGQTAVIIHILPPSAYKSDDDDDC